MLSPIVPYSLLKMHWNPEHAQPLSQWPEQHLDVSSTTSSPAHKSELYPGRGHHGSYSHAWANDDISALTASNLLKRYAEKYTLDSPYDRPPATAATAYPEPFGGLCGPKAELEPWTLTHADGPYPLGHEGLPGAKGAASSAGGASGGNNSSLSDSGYSGSSSCSGSHSGDYPPSYSYLSSGYCPQPAPPTLVPGYSPTAPVYGYPTGAYPHQAGLAPSGYGHPPATYLPGALAAPTPLPQRPTAVGGGSYGSYQSSGLGPAEPGGGGPLKRKAFEMSLDEGEDGEGPPRYRKYGYDPMKAGGGGGGGSSPYGVGDKGECRGSGFSSSSSTDPQTFKPGKLPSSQPLVSPPYGVAAGEYSPPAGLTGDSGSGGDDGDGGFGQRQTSHKGLQLCGQTGDPPGDPRLMLDGELLDRSPALGWGELCGLGHVKASLEEDLLWPALRPGAGVPRPPWTLLLFGPRGGGKTTLVRSLAAQLGAALFRVSGAALASEGKAEAERALAAVLRVAAAARQPAVVLLSQAEALEEAGGEALPAALEKAEQETPGRPPLLLVCATGRPDLLRDGVRRGFAKRYHVGLPDTAARRQVLLRALGPRGCGLGEAELGAVLRRSEGFSVWELLQLSQQALASSASGGASMHGLPTSATPPPAFTDFENAFCKVRPHATPEELDACAEWSKGYGH